MKIRPKKEGRIMKICTDVQAILKKCTAEGKSRRGTFF